MLGRDLPGALTVTPSDEGEWLEEPSDNPSANDSTTGIAQESLRFSLAGVQLKFSAIRNNHGGLTIPAKGVGGEWIVKLPSQQFAGVPENEFSMMTLARLVGIDVPAIDLVDTSAIANLPDGVERLGPKAFVIERFDRAGGPVHIEDFAQVFDVYPEKKYQKAGFRNLLSVVAAESDHRDVAEFIRRLTFNVLIGNGDMHLKNWSLIGPLVARLRLRVNAALSAQRPLRSDV